MAENQQNRSSLNTMKHQKKLTGGAVKVRGLIKLDREGIEVERFIL